MARKHTTMMLSNEAWVAINELAVIEGKSANDLCVYLLEEYSRFDEKVIYKTPQIERSDRSLHSIYISEDVWPQIKILKASQRRPISDILEQLIRAYTGLELGEQISW